MRRALQDEDGEARRHRNGPARTGVQPEAGNGDHRYPTESGVGGLAKKSFRISGCRAEMAPRRGPA